MIIIISFEDTGHHSMDKAVRISPYREMRAGEVSMNFLG